MNEFDEFEKFKEIMQCFKADTGYYPAKSDVIRFVQPLFKIDLSYEYNRIVYHDA